LFREICRGINGGFDARSLNYIQSGALPILEWIRLPGDVVFIVGGALPIIVLCWQGLRNVLREKPSSPDSVLFTEVVISASAAREVEV
jgi:nitric oxide reductase subunit B